MRQNSRRELLDLGKADCLPSERTKRNRCRLDPAEHTDESDWLAVVIRVVHAASSKSPRTTIDVFVRYA